jgi:hypothetical protein
MTSHYCRQYPILAGVLGWVTKFIKDLYGIFILFRDKDPLEIRPQAESVSPFGLNPWAENRINYIMIHYTKSTLYDLSNPTLLKMIQIKRSLVVIMEIIFHHLSVILLY